MSILDKFINREHAPEDLDDKIYDEVAIELNKGIKQEGLWVKAIGNSNGDKEKAKSLYIQYRAKKLKKEIEAKNIELKQRDNVIKEEESSQIIDEYLDDAITLLTETGYTVEQQGIMWVVKDSKGTIEYFETERSLYDYATSRNYTKEANTESIEVPKKNILKTILTWFFAIIGVIIIKMCVDISSHPNRQERLDQAVKDAIKETTLKNEPHFTMGDNKSPPSDYDEYVTAIILQMKMVIINKDTPASIEEKINKARGMGLTEIHLDRYSHNKIGWSAKVSEDRNVYSIIITFNDNSKSTVKYLASLMSKDDASTMLGWHDKTMKNHYSLNAPNNFNIGDNCSAILSQFNGKSGLSRVTINVSCQ